MEGFTLEVGVEGEVVEAAVGEAVAVVFLRLGQSVSAIGSFCKDCATGGLWGDGRSTFCMLDPGDQVRFCEGGD